MKNLFLLIAMFTVVFIFNSCGKCRDQSTKTSYVDRSYLPDIIPYSDTSTRLFLKNGKDTLLFKSLGLNQSLQEIITSTTSECTEKHKNEKLLLRMAASDTDFFDICYYSKSNGASRVKFNYKSQTNNAEFSNYSFRNFFPPIININVLNTQYDTVNVFPITSNDIIYFKTNIGIIKIQTLNFTYEIIK